MKTAIKDATGKDNRAHFHFYERDLSFNFFLALQLLSKKYIYV